MLGNANVIRTVLVDHHVMFLEPLAKVVSADPEIDVVGIATDGDDGLRLILNAAVDVAVLDLQLPGRSAFDVAHELSTRRPETNVLFLSGFVSDVFIAEALRLDARGYLVKTERPASLIKSIKRVAAGEICFSQEVKDRLAPDSSNGRHVVRAESRLLSLTPRQMEVLRHLARGKSVKEVARLMHVSAKSIDSHKYRIMHKLEIHDRVELARFAIREGLSFP